MRPRIVFKTQVTAVRRASAAGFDFLISSGVEAESRGGNNAVALRSAKDIAKIVFGLLSHRPTHRCCCSGAQDPDDFSAARSLMLISDVRVRCTGHFAAISITFACCASLNEPVSSISTSILSSMPSRVSHSSQSLA